MKRKKILKALAGILDEGRRKQRRHREELEGLLSALQEKATKLERELAGEKRKSKRKLLRKQLDIVKAQYAKGMTILQDLREEQ